MFANDGLIKQLQKSNCRWLGETLKEACGFLSPPLYCSSGFRVVFCLGCIAFNLIFRCQCWTSVKSMYMVSCCISLIKIKFAFYLRKCCKIFNKSIFAGTTHADGILTVQMGSDVTRFSSSIAGISLCGSSDQEIPHPGLIRTIHHLSLPMRKHLACWSPSARTCMRNS